MKVNIKRIAVDLDEDSASKLRMYCTINCITLKDAIKKLIDENINIK